MNDFKKRAFFFFLYLQNDTGSFRAKLLHAHIHFLCQNITIQWLRFTHSSTTIELVPQGNFHCRAIPLPLHEKHCIATSLLGKMSCRTNHINQQLAMSINMQN